LVKRLSEAGLSVLATTGAAGLDLDTAADGGILELPTAWLFGSESHGLPDDLVALADESVRVPIYGRAESLNLATAAAICLYASASAHRRTGSQPQHVTRLLADLEAQNDARSEAQNDAQVEAARIREL